MLNHITIMGRLTHDPELRKTAMGTSVCSFSVACDRDYKPEGGERETDFIDVVVWRHTAEFLCKYFSKGSMAVICGRLQIRRWVDNEGNNRRSAEIIAENVYFCERRKKNSPETADPVYEDADAPPARDMSELAQYDNVQFADYATPDDYGHY